MKSEWFDPHTSFLSLRVVWVTVGTLLFMSIASASVIICNSELTVDFSFNGFNQFISIFRFPLGIAALIIPMVALLAANHRSEQTKEQIRVTNAQNVFSNYYKHIEEFIKYLSDGVGKSFDLRFVHSNVYPDASLGDYSISSNLRELTEALDKLPCDILKNYQGDTQGEASYYIIRKYLGIVEQIYKFYYRESHDYARLIEISVPDQYSDTSIFKYRSLIKISQNAIKFSESFCKFSIDFSSQIFHLDSNILNMEAVYVQETPEDIKPWDNYSDKEDQTLEKANEVFLEMLSKSVNRD